MPNYDYDLIVIGSGPAGQRAAIQAAKLDKRVAIVERKAVVGGVSVNTGTIPSKTFREAVLDLSGFRERAFYGAVLHGQAEHHDRGPAAAHRSGDPARNRRDRGISSPATASSLSRRRLPSSIAHTLRLDVRGRSRASGWSPPNIIVIATGTEATMDPHIPFDGQRIITSDDILRLDRLPRTIAVVGAGVIGCEYASMFAALGRARDADRSSGPRLLPFVDAEIVDALAYHLRENRVTMRLNEEVSSIEPVRDEHGDRVQDSSVSGKQVVAEKALYSIGRTGNTAKLNLRRPGCKLTIAVA